MGIILENEVFNFLITHTAIMHHTFKQFKTYPAQNFLATEGFPNFSFCSYLLGLRNRTHNQTQRRIVNKPCTFLDFSEKLHNGANVFLKSTICTYFSDSTISRDISSFIFNRIKWVVEFLPKKVSPISKLAKGASYTNWS